MKKHTGTRATRATRAVGAALLAALSAASLLAFASPAGAASTTATRSVATPMAATAGIYFVDVTQGATPFIGLARFQGSALSNVQSVTFKIASRIGATAAPVKVTYSLAWLATRGYVPTGGPMTVPLFGLYAGETNSITVVFNFTDGTKQSLGLNIPTAAYTDPNGVYDHPQILTARNPNYKLGYSYLYVKSGLGSPIVLDVDGAIRWVGASVPSAFSSTFVNGTFVIGSSNSPTMYNLGIDGAWAKGSIDFATTRDFDHDMSPGREAILAGVNTKTADGITHYQSTTVEMTSDGHVIRYWDFEKIIGDYMTSQGDDASLFVKPGQNWLHINAQYYDARDNSLVISSREQFVMKVDYDTGAIKWLLGDPTKWWHNFASLRAKALSGPKDKFWPIGQHGIVLRNDGALLLFNNGAPSDNMPPGEPAGQSRAYSAVSAYAIDEVGRKAKDVYRFDHGQTLKAAVCSSVHQSADNSLIIDWASPYDATAAILTGLDPAGNTAFEYQYVSKGCAVAWHTDLIPFENMSLQ